MEKTIESGLPAAFAEKMRRLLGEEADAFFNSYGEGRRYGLRVNPLKCGADLPENVKNLKKIPWAAEGYYYEEEMRPGKHPYHEAGLYYIQEPSAMAVAEALEPKPGERILDLCAAPGGKSTHLAGKMDQKGLLVCNEIHPARAKILAQNVERMGIANAVVTNMEPAGLVPAFRGFFDGIVVDAPCSGEGMFRKDENARNEWSPDHVKLCADRQDMILDCAADMLKAGGRIAYSTCTFSPEENEQAVVRFLMRHPEFRVEMPVCAEYFSSGRPEWCREMEGIDEEMLSAMQIGRTVRIWPHKNDGEGHFLALLVKDGEAADAEWWKDGEEPVENSGSDRRKRGKTNEKKAGKNSGKNAGKSGGKNGRKQAGNAAGEPGSYYDFCEDLLVSGSAPEEGRRFLTFGENLYLIPEEMPPMEGLKVLRPGLHAGTLKKGRMEPSHALALYLKKDQAVKVLEIGSGETAERYLKGETLTIPEEEASMKGWVLVTVDGYSAGFGKADRGVLKNHYPRGLRKM